MSELNQTPLMTGTARQILGTRTEPPSFEAIASLRTDERHMKEDISYIQYYSYKTEHCGPKPSGFCSYFHNISFFFF